MSESQVHVPLRARTVNAEDFTSPEAREKLFTPNAEVVPAYDLLADPQGTYVLVAERGMGKTHVLLVLEDQLEKRTDVIIHISPKSPEVISTYFSLKEVYPDEKKSSVIWQLAILEFVGLKLLDPQLRLRKKWLLFSGSRIRVLVNYYRKHQPNELDNQIKHWAKQLKESDKSSLTEFLITVETWAGKLTTSGKAEKDKNELIKQSIVSRISLIGSWVWDSLSELRKRIHQTDETKTSPMTKFLPKSKSVYVIADGLDQMDEIQNEDLVGLIEAVKLLNEKSKEGLESDNPNFKMIMALRAITYDYSIGLTYKHTTHLWGNIHRLSWDDSLKDNHPSKDMCLKRMMAKFIIAYSQDVIEENNIENILNMVFPSEVVYFGRKFSSGTKFILEYTERRPREILLLWQSASENAKSTSLYSTKLTAQDLVNGLKNYSTNKLLEDIGTEYETEFPGIKLLLKHFKDNHGSISRVTSKDALKDLIMDFVFDIPENDRPQWMSKGFDNILKIFFHVGIVGILPDEENYEPNWPDAQYAKDDPDKSLDSSNLFAIRPAFWNYMTNIKTETYQIRQYTLNLYRELQSHIVKLDNQFDSLTDQKSFEMTLGRFLVLCDSVKQFNEYPEPLDWDCWIKVVEKLQVIYDKFKNTPLCMSKTELDRMIEIYKGVTLIEASTTSSAKIQFNDLKTFIALTNDNKEYKQALRSTLNWFDPKQKDVNPERIKQFRASLVVGQDSFHYILGNTITGVAKLL